MVNKRKEALEPGMLAGGPKQASEGSSGPSSPAAAGTQSCGPSDQGLWPLPSEISHPVV